MTPRFDNLADLARLPYFRVEGGRLVLSDPSLGPTIDVHTHLALAYGLPNQVDLSREWPETEHYLPTTATIDLDVYINKNFAPEHLEALEHDLVWMSATGRGMRRTHTVPNLAREMRELGVARSVLLPIDYPVLSRNAENWLEAARGRRDFVCFGSVHPFRPGLEARLDAQIALGARGLKVHPAVQLVGPDHPRAMRVYALAAARRIPVFFHCGPVGIEKPSGRRLTQVHRYEKPVAENPGCTFVLGHSGALQWREALELCKRYPNVWLETSSQGLPAVRTILEQAPRDRLLFGSDWPFYHQAIGLAKLFLATEGDVALRAAVTHENAQRLLGLGEARASG
jgi:hypothetical protein